MWSRLSNLNHKIGNFTLGVHCSLQPRLFHLALAANNSNLGDSEVWSWKLRRKTSLGHPGQHRSMQMLTPTKREKKGNLSMSVIRRRNKQDTLSYKEARARSLLSWWLCFHFFQLLSFTSANHFSVKHETQPACPHSALIPFFTLCISGQDQKMGKVSQSQHWQRRQWW